MGGGGGKVIPKGDKNPAEHALFNISGGEQGSLGKIETILMDLQGNWKFSTEELVQGGKR